MLTCVQAPEEDERPDEPETEEYGERSVHRLRNVECPKVQLIFIFQKLKDFLKLNRGHQRTLFLSTNYMIIIIKIITQTEAYHLDYVICFCPNYRHFSFALPFSSNLNGLQYWYTCIVWNYLAIFLYLIVINASGRGILLRQMNVFFLASWAWNWN